MRTISILGSTGSIGTQALQIAALHPDRFRIGALTAHSQESVASTRSRMYQKIFGKKGTTKEWDEFVMSL